MLALSTDGKPSQPLQMQAPKKSAIEKRVVMMQIEVRTGHVAVSQEQDLEVKWSSGSNSISTKKKRVSP